MELFIPSSLKTGKAVDVCLIDGPPHTTAVVEIDNGGWPEPQTLRLEIPLDANGKGHRNWIVPRWRWVNLKCDECEGACVSVRPPTPLSTRAIDVLRQSVRAIGFIAGDAGREYGIGAWRRFKLIVEVFRHHRRTRALSTRAQHLHLIEAILRVPRSLDGDVVECGCYNGGSTVALSLACASTHRRLFVCDSFEGLPEPRDDDQRAFRGDGSTVPWRKGFYASKGGLDGVKRQVATYGRIEVCRFVKGFFADTLGDLDTKAIVLVFEDADLVSSVEDCLRHLWPKLQPGGRFYSHEPWSFDIVSLFYDKTWWKRELDLMPPGFFGSGSGVDSASQMGYALKLAPARDRRHKHGRGVGDEGVGTPS